MSFDKSLGIQLPLYYSVYILYFCLFASECLLTVVKYYGTGSLQHRSQHSHRRCGTDWFHHVFIILFHLISFLAVWPCSKCTYSYGHRSNLSTFVFPPCRKRPPGLYFILDFFGIHTSIVWYNISQSDMPCFLCLR